MSGTARLFVALWPTPAVRRAVLAHRDGWTFPPPARLVAPGKLHLTLHFLGNVPVARIPELVAGLDVAAPDAELLFDRAEVWPNGVALLSPQEVPAPLFELHARLGESLQRLQLPLEPRAYRPHLTLARAAHGAVAPAQPPAIRWPVHGFALVQSVPGAGGGYVQLASWPLRGEDAAAAGDNPTPLQHRAAMPDALDTPDTPEPATPLADGAASAAPPALPERHSELSLADCGPKLAELFPALFGAAGTPKPLKLRIQADIQQRAPGVFSRRLLGAFFSRYTTGNAYLKALLEAPHRYDLDGQPAGEIAAEHKAAAAEELARRRAVHEARRAAQRAAGQKHRAHEKAAPRQRQRTERAARAEDGERAAVKERTGAQNAALPQDPARRERAQLLRAFEASPLTKANFCALKRMSEPELDALLAQAKRERDERPQPARVPGAPRH